MYNEELDLLIDAALIDGVITDKEKAILFKKAEKLGVDLDEFELILNAKILKLRREEEEKYTREKAKSQKLGDLRKCPSCGAMIGSFLMRCPECGYEFSGVGPNKYVSDFSAALENLEKDTPTPSSGIFDMFESGEMLDERKQKLILHKEARLVKNYPLPMTKEDSIEMLYFMLPKTKFVGSNKTTYAWRSKFFEILKRTERYAAKDQQMQILLQQMREDSKINILSKFVIWWKSLSNRTQVLVFCLIFYVILFVFIYYMALFE